MVFDLSSLKKSDVNPNEPMMRLLVCKKCKTIDDVPPYEGPEGGENTVQYDHHLKFFVDPHVDKNCPNQDRLVYHLPVKYWIVPKVKESIVAQIQAGGSQGLDVFGTNFYATSNNFRADAMTCWIKEHNQTKDCSDYKSEKKKLKPGTTKERADAGLDSESKVKVYLCDFCPVKSLVQEKAYKKQGLYK